MTTTPITTLMTLSYRNANIHAVFLEHSSDIYFVECDIRKIFNNNCEIKREFEFVEIDGEVKHLALINSFNLYKLCFSENSEDSNELAEYMYLNRKLFDSLEEVNREPINN